MKLFSIISLWFLIHSNGILASIGISNLQDTLNNVVTNVEQDISSVISTPEDLLTLPIENLLGLAETSAFDILSTLCAVLVQNNLTESLITPDFDAMSFHLHSACNETIFPLNQAEDILQSPNFDVNKKLAIFVTGWTTTSEESYVFDMANAFLCRGDYNFIVLNSSDSIQSLYTWSASNTEEVGRKVAKALEKLTEQVPPENIHFIGHSLGAHIVGYAGRYFTNYTGSTLYRVTGLDPAKPCFDGTKRLPGLQRGDAKFVDVIHTNPGVLGKENPVGNVDFYVQGLEPFKPGCIEFGCSHRLAYELFIETAYPGNEQNFLGLSCTSLMDMESGFCNGPLYPMGFAVPTDLNGNFFLSINGEKPYGKNNEGRPAVPTQCMNLCK